MTNLYVTKRTLFAWLCANRNSSDVLF